LAFTTGNHVRGVAFVEQRRLDGGGLAYRVLISAEPRDRGAIQPFGIGFGRRAFEDTGLDVVGEQDRPVIGTGSSILDGDG